MRKFDIRRTLQVGDGPSELEDPEIDPGREVQSFHSTLDESILFFTENAKLFYIFIPHFGIVGLFGSGKPLPPEDSGLFDPGFEFR